MNKKITLELVGLDGNAFSLMGAFSRQARREGWTQDEINTVLDDARSGNYDHLLQVLIAHCESPEQEYGDDDERNDWDDE